MEELPPFVGDWEQQRRLGSGGFGDVYLWKNRSTGQSVAIKKCRLSSTLSDDEERKFKARWKQEIKWMKDFRNDCIVQAVETQPPEFAQALNKCNAVDLPVLIMEFCEGGDLRSLLSRIENVNGLPENEVRLVLTCLRDAVFYLHEKFKIAHRDLKPENIVMATYDGRRIYKLTDMGYAKNIDHNTVQASLIGTKDYFAPEIITDLEYTNSVDYWSMGVIAFEILCGVRPFVPHQTPATWLIQINQKTSNYIAISETNDGKFVPREHLYEENFISKTFRHLMEKWLVIALERSRKARGYAPMSHANGTLQKELVFYKHLDVALSTVVLTVFNLSAYEFCSYVLYRDMSLKTLITNISTDTGIPISDLCIILPYNHAVSEFTENTTAMDMYMPDWSAELPMLYVKKRRSSLQPVEPSISATVKLVLAAKSSLKKHVLQEFVRHAIFFFRNENRKQNAFLHGLKNFAMLMETELLKFQTRIESANKEIAYSTGGVDLFHKIVLQGNAAFRNANKRDVEDKWLDNVSGIYKTLEALTHVVQRLQLRFKSAVRRIQERLHSSVFTDIDKDFFGVKNFEEMVQSISQSNVNEFVAAASNSICECLRKRAEWFRATDIVHVQTEIDEIYDEFQGIRSIEQKFTSELQRFSSKLDEFTKSFPRELSECTKGPDLTLPSAEVFTNALKLNNSNCSDEASSMQVDALTDCLDSNETRQILSETKMWLSRFEMHLLGEADMECNV